MGHSNRKKEVKTNLVDAKKDVKIPQVKEESKGLPIFHFNKIDRDGPFAFDLCRDCFQSDDFLEKVIGYSSMLWREIDRQTHDAGKSKHHYLKNPDGLSKEAKERLAKLDLNEETDNLYSFAFDNTLRIVGLRFEDDFFILWYDSNHEVYPSKKKHT